MEERVKMEIRNQIKEIIRAPPPQPPLCGQVGEGLRISPILVSPEFPRTTKIQASIVGII